MGRGANRAYQRRRRRSFVAAALTFVFLWLGFGTIFAGTPGASVSPTHGLRGSSVTLHGDVCPASCSATWNIRIFWDWVNPSQSGQELTDTDHQPTVPDADGKFTFTFDVPLDSPDTQDVGPHNIHVCLNITSTAAVDPAGLPTCRDGEFDTTYTIDKPKLTFNRSHGRAGETRSAIGKGFMPNNPALDFAPEVWVIWDPSGENLPVFEGLAAAPWNVPITIPSDATFGTHTVLACDRGRASCIPGEQAKAKFTVTYPQIFLTTHQGLAGDVIQVNGNGMYATRTLRLFFGTKDVPRTVEYFANPNPTKSTNANGGYPKFNITIPDLPPGLYRVTACTMVRSDSGFDCENRLPTDPRFDSPHTGFTILAPPTPTPEITPSPTPEPTPRPTAHPTQHPTSEPTPQPAPEPTASPEPSPSPESPSPSPEPSPSPSPEPPTPSPVITPELTPSPVITSEPTATPEVSTAPAVTPEPSVAPTPEPSAAPAFWPQYLRDPGSDGSLGNLGAVGGSALLALLVAFLIPFPGTLFNKTVEANQAEIQGWFARLQNGWRGFVKRVAIGPLAPVVALLGRGMTGLPGVWAFLLLTSLVYGFLSPSFGLNFNSLVLFAGLLVGLAFITAAFDLPLRVYHRRRTQKRDAGVLRALWWTLLIAIICVVISRLAGFQPGYLYGLIISLVFVTEISIRDEGLGTWLASVWLLALSFVAWLLLGFVRAQGGGATVQLFIQTILATFVVAGIEALVIGLLPMRFLPGHPLFEWRRSLWFPVFALAVFGYLLILVDPANGYLSDNSRTPMIVGIVFLVGFGTISLGTWAYFRYRPARTGGDRPGEAPELPGEHPG